jgi:hypothetical protein
MISGFEIPFRQNTEPKVFCPPVLFYNICIILLSDSSNNKSLLSRYESVPVHQMVQTLQSNNFTIKDGHQLMPTITIKIHVTNIYFDETENISISYPLNPIFNQKFSFEQLFTKIQSIIGSDDSISGNV